jgi:hypothetical protein
MHQIQNNVLALAMCNRQRGAVLTAARQAWMAYPTGRSGCSLGAVMIRTKRQVRAELYLSGGNAKAHFGLLKQQKEAIERELGYALEWEELPEGQDSRIASYLNDADPEDRADWPRQHEWLTKRLNDMRRVFGDRVKTLDADQWQPEAGN